MLLVYEICYKMYQCVFSDNDEVNKLALPLLDGLTCKLLECSNLAMNNRLYEKTNISTVIQEALIEV